MHRFEHQETAHAGYGINEEREHAIPAYRWRRSSHQTLYLPAFKSDGLLGGDDAKKRKRLCEAVAQRHVRFPC